MSKQDSPSDSQENKEVVIVDTEDAVVFDAGSGSGSRSDSEFEASAGVRDVGFTLSSRFPLWRQLSLIGAINYERLLGDAADSPLTEDRGDANQVSATLGLIYRF